jgi:hypothetical protein
VPIIPYSGGSSLEGNFSAPFGGISVDFAYMDNIIQFNKEDMDIVVQPSIGWQDLNEQLSRMGSGLFFPIDPGMYFKGSLPILFPAWSQCLFKCSVLTLEIDLYDAHLLTDRILQQARVPRSVV